MRRSRSDGQGAWPHRKRMTRATRGALESTCENTACENIDRHRRTHRYGAEKRATFSFIRSVAGFYLECRPGVGHVAGHSIANFYYLVSSARSDRTPRSFIDSLCSFVRVAQTSTEGIRFALNLDIKDFEDAMQVAAASACGANIIATRNLKDYANSSIRAASPRELLEEIGVG